MSAPTEAAPTNPPWTTRLPERVSLLSVHLAHAEIERRRQLLVWGHGDEKAMELAGQMALAQAYERIAQLEDARLRVTS